MRRRISARSMRELLRRHVGETFKHVTGFRPAGAAEGVGRRGVGEDTGHLDEDRGRAVAAREQGAVDRARNGGAEGRDIGAEIGRGVDVQGEETAVGGERKPRMGEVIAGLVVRHEALGAGRHPAHRAAQPARGPGDDPLLRIELALVAEAAADIGRDHAQRALGDAELLGHLAANVMGGLRRGVEREPAAVRLGGGDGRARLDRRPHQAVVDEIDRHHVGGRCERRAHGGFVAARPAKADIAGRRLVQLRRARRLRGARVGDGGKRLVINLDALGGVGGLQQRVGDHRHDRLAAMAHGAAREREARRLRHRRAVARAHRPQRPHRRHAVRGHVGAGEHRDHAGQCHRRRCVDPANARVRVRRAHQHAGERAGKLDVGDEAPAPEQETAILDPPQRRADALVVSRPGALARVRHRRATYSLVRCRLLRCHLARFRRKGYRAGPQGARFCTASAVPGRFWRKETIGQTAA